MNLALTITWYDTYRLFYVVICEVSRLDRDIGLLESNIFNVGANLPSQLNNNFTHLVPLGQSKEWFKKNSAQLLEKDGNAVDNDPDTLAFSSNGVVVT